jgi:hypothetical protein
LRQKLFGMCNIVEAFIGSDLYPSHYKIQQARHRMPTRAPVLPVKSPPHSFRTPHERSRDQLENRGTIE